MNKPTEHDKLVTAAEENICVIDNLLAHPKENEQSIRTTIYATMKILQKIRSVGAET